MKTVQLKSKSKALVLVAHPDDETIWMGGTILRAKHVAWTIFSLCRLSDKDREPKFRRVCRLYGAKSIMTDLEDEDVMGIKDSVPLIKKLIRQKLGNTEFDYLFTHGENGDYGHPRHIGVHLAVKEMLKEGTLRAKKVFYFNYKKAVGKKTPLMEMKPDSEYAVELSDKEYNEKKRIVAQIHGYPFDGIDVNLSPNPEAFISVQQPGS